MATCVWKRCKQTAPHCKRKNKPRLCEKHCDLFKQGKSPRGRPTKRWKNSRLKFPKKGVGDWIKRRMRAKAIARKRHSPNPAKKKTKKRKRPRLSIREKNKQRRRHEAFLRRKYCAAWTNANKPCSRKWVVKGWKKPDLVVDYLRGVRVSRWRTVHYCKQHAKQQSKLKKFRKTKPR